MHKHGKSSATMRSARAVMQTEAAMKSKKTAKTSLFLLTRLS